jgi:hypothetical protein
VGDERAVDGAEGAELTEAQWSRRRGWRWRRRSKIDGQMVTGEPKDEKDKAR